MQTLGNDGDANPDAAGRAALMRAGRRLLWTLINDTVLPSVHVVIARERAWSRTMCGSSRSLLPASLTVCSLMHLFESLVLYKPGSHHDTFQHSAHRISSI